MNRPDPLGEFRADIPGPGPDSRERARALLQRAIDTQRDAHGTVAAGNARRLGANRMGTGRVGRRWLLRGVAAGAVAVTASVVLVSAPWRTGPAASQTAAAAVLGQAARAAATVKAPALGAEAFIEVRIRARWSATDESSGVTYLQDEVNWNWLPTGNGATAVHRTVFGAHTFLRASDQARLGSSSQPPTPGTSQTFGYPAWHGSFADPSLAFTATLPTDVSRLYARIRDDAGGDTGAARLRMLQDAGNVLGFSVTFPALRAALYQTVVRIPGVRLVPDTRDYVGRPGTTVAVTDGGDEQDLIFDPATGSLLGQREVLHTARPGIPAGTVVGWSSFQIFLVSSAPRT